ncbi:hypothetical protein Fmac_021750 [Flemingia macrophylla]|uniref:Uncharacterized protein n=1 Tax=Flemingia macrophylla TaxID=520843 RepID=A0ABD1LYB2_9FABA
MAKIIRQSKRNKNEFYVGKEWGELVTKNGFEADDLLSIDIIERDDDNRVAVLQDRVLMHDEFYKYWKGRIQEGNCTFTDPEGNRFTMELETFVGNSCMLRGGVIDMCKFYGLVDKHIAYFHYEGGINFIVKILNVHNEEISCPPLPPRFATFRR